MRIIQQGFRIMDGPDAIFHAAQVPIYQQHHASGDLSYMNDLWLTVEFIGNRYFPLNIRWHKCHVGRSGSGLVLERPIMLEEDNELTFIAAANENLSQAHAHYLSNCEAVYYDTIETYQAPGCARNALPGDIGYKMIMQADFLDWRRIFLTKWDQEIGSNFRYLIGGLLDTLKSTYHVSFDDTPTYVEYRDKDKG